MYRNRCFEKVVFIFVYLYFYNKYIWIIKQNQITQIFQDENIRK